MYKNKQPTSVEGASIPNHKGIIYRLIGITFNWSCELIEFNNITVSVTSMSLLSLKVKHATPYSVD